LLMAFLGFMQFINSPSVAKSILSGAGNSLVLGFALLWWRRSGGARWSLCELLPGTRGMKIFGLLLLIWYLFWGFAIKPSSIPGMLKGQLTILVLYAVLLVVFVRSLRRSRADITEPKGLGENRSIVFTWRGFVLACAVATVVTTISRLLLLPFAALQVLVLFSFYVLAGLFLFIGSVIYAGSAKAHPPGA